MLKQNKPDGFMCVSCAWAKPAKPHPFEFARTAPRRRAWEMTHKQAAPDFFARHTVTELLGWADYDLEEKGRLTHPMRWDAASDRYLPVGWDEAFREIGRELQGFDPHAWCSTRRAGPRSKPPICTPSSARMYGTNNFPDSSNMCHESTSVALPESIGVPVGTVPLDDFEHDRLHLLLRPERRQQQPRACCTSCRRRGERGVADRHLQSAARARPGELHEPAVAGRDADALVDARSAPSIIRSRRAATSAAIFGVCKALVTLDDAAQAAGEPRVLDTAFLAEHTHGFDAFIAAARAYDWPELERRSGLTRTAMEAAAEVYARAKATIGIYGMGLTQHRTGVDNCQMVVNLLLLRGNIGQPGAGICPGAGPFQRAGPAHRRHHRKARARAARPACASSTGSSRRARKG